MSTIALELTVRNLRHELARPSAVPRDGSPIVDGMAVLTQCLRRRQLGCGLYLSDLDEGGFREQLRFSALDYIELLKRAADPYALCASRAQPLFDALAIREWAIAEEIARRLPEAWAPRMEPKADFVFVRSVANLVLGGPDVNPGVDNAAMDVIAAIQQGDARGFGKALVAFIGEWGREVEAARDREALDPYSTSTLAFFCVEALALAQLAYHRRELRVLQAIHSVPQELLP